MKLGDTMKVLRDHRGDAVRFTEERLSPILEHPEMRGMEREIGETLARPEHIVKSRSDSEANLYYRFYPQTPVGEKYLCVVVKRKRADAFVLTAYLTDTVKKGEILWSAKP
jgi:hypothetical protein